MTVSVSEPRIDERGNPLGSAEAGGPADIA